MCIPLKRSFPCRLNVGHPWCAYREDVTLSTKLKDLHDQIKFLKNKTLELNYKLHNFDKNGLTFLKKDNTKTILDQRMKIYLV